MRRIPILVALAVVLCASPALGKRNVDPKLYGSPEGQVCIKCHELKSPALFKMWRSGRMGQAGVNCYDCHRAEKAVGNKPGDPDGYDHRGFWIATLVTPKDCSRCHKDQFDQQQPSHHAKGADILNTLDNYLGEVVGGPEAVATGCRQCHGSNIKVLKNGKLDPSTWPNTGIGRINPDGSKGSCSACHTRHRFSVEQARRPDACGKCHLGPDHPQIEVYQESKHGILYSAFRDKMNMDRVEWIVGVDYEDTATCSTCHISATPNQKSTHDVGARISWTLRPVVSKKLTNWEERRDRMKDVCRQCHGEEMVGGFYKQFDDLVELYNTKFAIPAQNMRNELIKMGKLTPADMDDKLDWIFYELWHHEGRRARHGASMSGPDYAWWHGMYEVAQHFYIKFIPEVEALLGGKAAAAPFLQKHIFNDPRHRWYKEGMSKEELQKLQQWYQDRYGGKEAK
ncbi:MAG: cytochrome C552 [Deltaproteobacteria bacterium]|nr:cytochrome C552 [Deltaproteobacteria bacterium]